MTGERIAWAVLAAVLGEVLLSIGQVSAYLPVFALQVISSAALAGLVTCGIRRLRDAVTAPRPGAEAAPGRGRRDAVSTAAPGARGLSRAVVWTGIALGTCLAVLAISDGAVLRIGGLPSWLGTFLGALIVWALIAGTSVVLAELVRRHHKTAARYAVRQGRRGGAPPAGVPGRHGGRGPTRSPRGPGRAGSAVPAPSCPGPRRARPGPATTDTPGTPRPVRGTQPPRRICAACGNPENGLAATAALGAGGPMARAGGRPGPLHPPGALRGRVVRLLRPGVPGRCPLRPDQRNRRKQHDRQSPR